MTTDPTVRRAFIHGCVTVALALSALILGVSLDGTWRTILLAACPAIALIGAIAAGIRTYQSWKVDDRWPVWQGLLWFLLMTTLLLFMSVGPTVIGAVD